MESGQIRLNTATGEWVIYAPSRGKRPYDFQPTHSPSADSKKNCPFCDKSNHELEPIILELPHPQKKGWQTRVFSNRFPALMPSIIPKRSTEGLYLVMPGYGNHEIIVESPDHYQTLATLSIPEVRQVIETYHQRYLSLMKNPEIMMVIIFRNQGKTAGASLTHPHSQIIATGIVPRNRRWIEEEAQRYYDHWRRCVYCEMLDFEIEQGQRIIAENETFVAFVPFAAQVPCEIWIMPRQHQGDFGCISEQEKTDFATLLLYSLGKLYSKLNNPDYNLVIHTATRYKTEEPQVHWYCQIRPHLTTPAGFEMGAGISINPSTPEQDAAFLRQES